MRYSVQRHIYSFSEVGLIAQIMLGDGRITFKNARFLNIQIVMDTVTIEKAIVETKQEIEKAKRKFKQSIDLVIITKPRKSKSEEAVDTLAFLPNSVNEIKTCAFVDKDMMTQATGVFSKLVSKDDFAGFDKKSVRKLVKDYDYFFAEASIMAQVAAKFGKLLTATNKMPNPKTGTIIYPSTNLKAVEEKVHFATKINTKKNNAVIVKVGDEKTDDSKIVANVNAVYSTLKSSLVNGDASIKHVYIKPTMGKLVKI